jgi:hypothetical protein
MSFSLGSNNGTAHVQQPWLRDTVQAFFEGVAWSGPAFQHRTQPGGSSERSGSPMIMAVGDFFGSIPWDGQPVIGLPISPLEALPANPSPVQEEDDLTLDGFSDLFG